MGVLKWKTWTTFGMQQFSNLVLMIQNNPPLIQGEESWHPLYMGSHKALGRQRGVSRELMLLPSSHLHFCLQDSKPFFNFISWPSAFYYCQHLHPLKVGMGKDWAQRTNIFSPMDYKYRCCAMCDDHNRFSYEVKLPLQPAILQLQRHLLDLILWTTV